MKKLYLLMCLSLLISGPAMANNIAVANVSLTDQSALFNHVNVKFDLSWDNSWRTLLVPGNWDAAWVFVKYRVSGGEWQHATLDSLSANHTAPSGSEITPALDGKGVFIYRSSTGSGSNSWTNAKLRWKYGTDGVADDALLEVKVFAIEMVYIPGSDDYWLGDGNGTSESSYAFHGSTTDNTAKFFNTSITISVDVGGANDDGYITGTISQITLYSTGGFTIQSGAQTNVYFPTGRTSFYIMKYEISQEQYVDFLNCLTRTQQGTKVETDISGTSVTNRYVMSNTTSMMFRNCIRCDATIPAAPTPVTFYCDYDGDGVPNETADGQNLTCNYLVWMDAAAYLDWTGFRPMTEPEFEKSCRGPNNAMYGEFAWGSTGISTTPYAVTNAGAANETISNLSTATGNAHYFTTFLGGVARCGVFAASSSNHTRVETGASYYGVMEMSGNLMELTVHFGSFAGRSYRGHHGNGELNSSGYADVDYWPGINNNGSYTVANGVYGGTSGVTNFGGIGLRGGSLGSNSSYLRISDRNLAGQFYANRQNSSGCRGVRTAP